MKKSLPAFTLLLSTAFFSLPIWGGLGWGQSYQWAKNIGSANNDEGNSIAVDASGNVYITGWFEGTADFNPGAGTANLTAVGSADIFFAKYNSSGVYQWAKNIGSTNDDVGISIAVDASGNVYLTGYFQGTADFDPGAGTANLTTVGDWDIFFAKYNSSGVYQWAKNIGSANYDYGYSIAVDASGNVYITGFFYGTADFDPGAGTVNLTPVGVYDIFFAKYNSSGVYQWAKNIGSASSDVGYSIAVDASGNVYITGYFYGTADFDPGAGTANLTAVGNDDIFFAKYNSSGIYYWAKNIGSTINDMGNSIAVDASGNVYITGSFTGTADFDPGAGTANLTAVGNDDIFFAKYNSSGVYQWAKNIGSANYDYGYGIAVDASGNVYITGYFQNTADFDPGAGTANLTPVGYDIFFAKYNSSGDYQWAKSIGSANDDYGKSIAIDASGNVYITGYFSGTADFDPGAGTANLTPVLVGYEDIFFAKYSPLPAGMQELSASGLQVKVYPNPNNGVFTMKLPVADCQLRIFDVLGRDVYNMSNVRGQMSNLFEIDLSRAGAGVYRVQVVSDDSIFNAKLVIE